MTEWNEYLNSGQCNLDSSIETYGCKWEDNNCIYKSACSGNRSECSTTVGKNGRFCDYTGNKCLERTMTEC
jgi:hypothetical protein